MNNEERKELIYFATAIINDDPERFTRRFAERVKFFLETLETVVQEGSFNEFGTGY